MSVVAQNTLTKLLVVLQVASFVRVMMKPLCPIVKMVRDTGRLR